MSVLGATKPEPPTEKLSKTAAETCRTWLHRQQLEPLSVLPKFAKTALKSVFGKGGLYDWWLRPLRLVAAKAAVSVNMCRSLQWQHLQSVTVCCSLTYNQWICAVVCSGSTYNQWLCAAVWPTISECLTYNRRMCAVFNLQSVNVCCSLTYNQWMFDLQSENVCSI